MNKEDRIRMAIEAGWDLHQATCDTRIKEFAALVASDAQKKEREAIAKWLDDEKDATYWAELVRARVQA